MGWGCRAREPVDACRGPACGPCRPGAPTDADADQNPGTETADATTASRGRASQDTTRVLVTASHIPGDKIRDVVKVAVTPLIATGATVTVKLEVSASHPEGIPHDTLDLTVKEGLRQLNIDHHVTPN